MTFKSNDEINQKINDLLKQPDTIVIGGGILKKPFQKSKSGKSMYASIESENSGGYKTYTLVNTNNFEIASSLNVGDHIDFTGNVLYNPERKKIGLYIDQQKHSITNKMNKMRHVFYILHGTISNQPMVLTEKDFFVFDLQLASNKVLPIKGFFKNDTIIKLAQGSNVKMVCEQNALKNNETHEYVPYFKCFTLRLK